jgi:hypothetical protein
MEFQPNHRPDDEPQGSGHEQLDPGEIDFTGVVSQEKDLADVIHDAISSALLEGPIPEWGARTIARALANRLYYRFSGPLHSFAITGDLAPDSVVAQLVEVFNDTSDKEVREWAAWLGEYVISLSDDTDQTDTETQADPMPKTGDLPSGYSQITQGLRTHGVAFRAYLHLPDTDWNRDGLLEGFKDFYIGSYSSMSALLDELTEANKCQAAMDEIAIRYGFEGAAKLDRVMVDNYVRVTWDVIEAGGELHVFTI